jgi:hypothetical protein
LLGVIQYAFGGHVRSPELCGALATSLRRNARPSGCWHAAWWWRRYQPC